MKLQNLAFNWFDIFAAVVLIIGLFRGRKRGMSEELLDLLQALLMVVLSSMYYKPFGAFLSQFTRFALLLCYIAAYLLLMLGVKIVFMLIKRAAGEKLVGSDLFGRLEYYLGMLAGMTRWGCMLFMALALLHAPLVSDKEYEAKRKAHRELYGSEYFTLFQFTFYQRSAFVDSAIGPIIEKHLQPYLIESTAMSDLAEEREKGMGKTKEREIEELMRGNKH